MALEYPIGSRARTYRLAAAATVLGFPLMLVDAVRRSHPLHVNQFLQLPIEAGAIAPGLRDDESRTVRHSAWIDVSDGPIVITVCDLVGRHYCIMALDAWGDCVASVSSRGLPSERETLTIVGRNWTGRRASRGVAVRAQSNLVWVVSRVSERQPNVSPNGALPSPPLLSRMTETGLEPIEPATWSLAPDLMRALDLVAQLTPVEFFHRLGVLSERHPAPASNARLSHTLRRLAATMRDGDPDAQDAMAGGMAVGIGMIRRAAARQLPPAINQWTRAGVTFDLSHARGLTRAAQVWTSLGAPRAVDLIQFFCGADAEGAQLHGSERYELSFAPGQHPPANAFWEVSCAAQGLAYRSPGATVSSDQAPCLSEIGSLRILIQQSAPADDLRRNWLQPPDGPFSLALRLHWPTSDAVSGAWRTPPVERLSSLFPRAHRSLDEAWKSPTNPAAARRARSSHTLTSI